MYMTTLNALLSFNPAAPSNALFGRKVVLEKVSCLQLPSLFQHA